MSCTLALNAHFAEQQAQTLEPWGKESEKKGTLRKGWEGRKEEKGRPEKLEADKRDHWFVEQLSGLQSPDWIPDRTRNLD